jgi:hypothetical protein
MIRTAVEKLTEDLGKAPTYNDLSDYFCLRSSAHVRYYTKKAVDAGLICIDGDRQPHWIEVV